MGSAARLFFALWPDDATRTRCAKLATQLAEHGGRPVSAGNLHITLSFLGSVDNVQRACAERAADAVQAQPATLTLSRLGYFPKPRVVWLGAEPVPFALADLAADLNHRLDGCGIALDARPFALHMTLLRKAHGPAVLNVPEPIVWKIQSFSLVKSETLTTGPIYSVIRTWPLYKD
ncbi:MAG: RNA 2',3'-cyclic phosphodiesterase [Gammaproteobacteria bacterium]|nr:RNA 2',3'-cyclic phosphodiesterase [Gammaproteobacteria bacterium]